ncbi:hypothetical protein EAE96_006962 [Botrytis aclada]|nr:hypothetical protein EAE96_006962 [Botrytis aclada]
MILSNLFIASLGIAAVTSSQSSSAANVCLDALSSEPSNAKSFCIQYLLSSAIPVPSFASPCSGTDPSDNQLFKSCSQLLHQLENKVPPPEILKEVAPDQVSGWKQHAIIPRSAKIKREYDINAPDSPWRPVLPLYTPPILKSVLEDQVPSWRSQASAPLIPNPDVPPRTKSKPKPKPKHRRQLGPLPENFLEPPGRPDFIKAYPEKNTNDPLPPAPFNKLLEAIDPHTGKKLPIRIPNPKPKPNYSHSRISLQIFPSLKEIGLEQDGRGYQDKEDTNKNTNANEAENVNESEKSETAKRISDLQKIRDRRYAHKLHLQGTPKAYAQMREESERRGSKERKKMGMEEWEKQILRGVGRGGGEGRRRAGVVGRRR